MPLSSNLPTSPKGQVLTDLSTGAKCVNCSHSNPVDAKFCQGCGQSLWEKCEKCEKTVRLGSVFCGNCGLNLEAAHKAKRTEIKEFLVKARDYGKEHKYEDAIYFANLALESKDVRFKDLVEKANHLLEKLQTRWDKYQAKVEKITPLVNEAFESGNHDQVIELVGKLPESVVPESVKVLAARANGFLSEADGLKKGLAQAIANKRYEEAGETVGRMLQLEPDDQELKTLSSKIGKHLASSALRKFQKNDYRAAMQKLQAVPIDARDNDYNRLHAVLDEIFLLREQLISSPYASPALVAMSDRLAKLSSQDSTSSALCEQIRERLATGDANPRGLYPRWNTKNPEYLDCEVNYLANLQSIDGMDLPAIKSNRLRFSGAIGAALQGVGLAKVDFGFMEQKKGIGRFFKRKQKGARSAWGVDIGPSAIRAVRIEVSEDSETPRLTEAEFIPFDRVWTRPDHEKNASEIIQEAMQQLVEKHPLKDEPVWGLIPSRQALGRFLEFPPVTKKKLDELVLSEVSHQFPIPEDQLSWSSWTSFEEGESGVEESAKPIYGTIIGIRSWVVEQQLKIFEDAGIELTNLQVKPVALANLAFREFSDLLKEAESPPAVAILDVGTDTSVLLVCSSKGYWYKSFDIGGERFSHAIARLQKLTTEKADELKEDLLSMDCLAPTYEALKKPLGHLGGRVRHMLGVCKSELGDVSVKQFWCTGGGCLINGFMESVFADE